MCKKLAANGGVFWNAKLLDGQGSEFELTKYGQGATGEVISRTKIAWDVNGVHNVKNGMAAIAAAHHVGVDVATAAKALQQYKGVKRRLELRGEMEGVKVYDDFAHHPTAIMTTLQGMSMKLKTEAGSTRLIAIIEPRSNTMKLGIHQQQLLDACQYADMVVWQKPEKSRLDFNALIADSKVPTYAFSSTDEIVSFVEENAQAGDHIVVMSNGSFDAIHEKLLLALDKGPAGALAF